MEKTIERKIWIFTILIISVGLITLFSATIENVRVGQRVFFNQLGFALVGLAIMYGLGRIDYRRFYDVAYIIFGINVFLLILVLVSGRHALGATRWIEIAGFSFQPSEFTKLALILFLGRYFSHLRPTLSFDFLTRSQYLFTHLILPFLITGFMMLLIFKQPDLGTSILVFGIFLVMLFMSGLEYKYFLMFITVIVSFVPFAWHFLKDYQKERLLVFLNPNIDPLGAGYTIIQSKIAIGSGQVFGKGWQGGTQNQLNFLPERHTDFIFSVIGEEWGFLGALFMVYCYFMIINCAFKICEQLNDNFGVLVTSGIISILSLQAIINIGMVMGMFPVVGITLPLVSYGRTSFLIFAVMLGFLISLNRRRTMF